MIVTRRIKILRLSADALMRLFGPWKVVANPIPADAKIVDMHVEQGCTVVMKVESAEYPETVEGLPYPHAEPIQFEALPIITPTETTDETIAPRTPISGDADQA